MAKSYKPRRVKLKNHDAGYDRHNKGVAYEMKAARRSQSHVQQVSGRGLKKNETTKARIAQRQEHWLHTPGTSGSSPDTGTVPVAQR